jgi:hypothetical protein
MTYPIRQQVSPAKNSPSGAALKLWLPDELQPMRPTSDGTLTPQMKLSEFFKAWFLPVVLQGQDEISGSTIKLYHNAMHYWVELAGDPPINQIDEFVISKFVSLLRNTTFKRGRFGRDIPLKPNTVKKHITALRSIMYRIGPETDPRRTAKELIKKVPYMKIPTVRTQIKAPFTLDAARLIVAASRHMETPKASNVPAWMFWTAFCAGGFYLGVRSGTVLALRQNMAVKIRGEWWADIPQEAVPKTEKPVKRRLHPKLIEVWSRIFDMDNPTDKLIIEWPHDYRHLIRQHARLQEIAGFQKTLSPQVWRRTHGEEMAELGYRDAVQLAQESLDHSSASTTLNHYTDVKNKFVHRLPNLWEGPLASLYAG